MIRRSSTAALSITMTAALLLAGCADPDDPVSDPDATASDAPSLLTEIPDDFPLALGMGRDDEVDQLPTSGEPGISDFTFCGQDPLAEADPVDVRSVDNSGGESADTRDLRLFASSDEARRAAEAVRDLATACPEHETEGIASVRNEVRASPLAVEPSAALVQRYATDGEVGDDINAFHVVLAGNALLVSRTYGQVTAADEGSFVEGTASDLRRTVDAMSVFAGGATPSPAAADPVTAPPIPDDFPLAVDMPRDGGDFTVHPPSADGEGTSGGGGVTVCGRDVWPTGLDGDFARLVADASGPESYDAREVYTYPDITAAEAVMTTVREARTCETFENQVWHEVDSDVGDDSVTVGLSYSDGLGLSVFQWTRVGSAVLLTTSYREGDAATLARRVRELTATSRTIAEDMCVFSASGC